jgi:hypothetical protein
MVRLLAFVALLCVTGSLALELELKRVKRSDDFVRTERVRRFDDYDFDNGEFGDQDYEANFGNGFEIECDDKKLCEDDDYYYDDWENSGDDENTFGFALETRSGGRKGSGPLRKLGVTYSRYKAVSRMIQHIVYNKTALTRKQLIRKMLNYGCHCFQGTKRARSIGGKGPAVDDIDSVCRAQYQCHKCIEQEMGCNPDSTGYKVKFIGKRRDMVKDISCRQPENTCSRNLCECDKHMAFTLADIWTDDLHDTHYWMDKKNKRRNSVFDYDSTCVASNANSKADSCCGDFPTIVPYNSNDRNCCVDSNGVGRTYDPMTSTCCPDLTVRPHGSC